MHTENTCCPKEAVTHRGASTGVLSHLLRTRCDHRPSSQGTRAGVADLSLVCARAQHDDPRLRAAALRHLGLCACRL